MTLQELERRSSAVTLSDMEIFIFPELMYSLVLANIMSPRLWLWRDDPWFKGIRKMKPYRRLQRLKQYIMDHYVFNLDLETWGLTDQKRELARFSEFLDPEVIAQSNALFGYEGDTYYFDIDIRTHFGLDKYASDVIPYWKTETVEAMDAFRFREGFATGAGECVSLAALYAAALFVVAGIPLEKVFLMATPLHSQNFVDADDGVLINNRRLVTKAMWFNGTQISGQARRALEHERVTIVSHPTGWIHTLYRQATIEPESYGRFAAQLRTYLKTPLTPEILGNFLRQNPRCRQCFVLRWPVHGVNRYLTLEQAFSFEQESSYKVTDATRDKLLAMIPMETFAASCCPCKVVLNDIEEFVRARSIDLDKPEDLRALKDKIGDACMSATEMVAQLVRFCHTEPRLPATAGVAFESEQPPVRLAAEMTREEMVAQIESLRGRNVTADMAFYAWRDLSRTPYAPFAKAALERNPVSVAGAEGLAEESLVSRVASWPAESIYDGPARLAQPDEVWNFRRGDGFEKALLVANVVRSRGARALRLALEEGTAVLSEGDRRVCAFPSVKSPAETVWAL
ncbi:MAG TPA: hypothetical protein PKM57_07745 [Kiritimatiellia bacterium]|nr:hypothetical protein [Kiritimatiellia bacterium]HPS07902.1 hypothetical protein [Kiritimatiellia bacterium]